MAAKTNMRAFARFGGGRPALHSQQLQPHAAMRAARSARLPAAEPGRGQQLGGGAALQLGLELWPTPLPMPS